MPQPTIYGPDSFGAIRIPVDPATATQVPTSGPGDITPNDPCLWYIGSFLVAFCTTDENAKAQWDVAGVAAGFPPIRTAIVANPADEGYQFRDADLPALFLFRDTQDIGMLADCIGKAETSLKMLWVYPPGQPANAAKRLPFANVLPKIIYNGIERGRTPSWIIAGDTDPFALGGTPWVANAGHAVLDMMVPSPINGFAYQCTVAGASGPTAPTWPTTNGQTVVDGTCTWMCAGPAPAQGSLLYKYAGFAKLRDPKVRPTHVKITDVKGALVTKRPALELTWYLLEDMQFGITNRDALDPNAGMELTINRGVSQDVWQPGTSYDVNVQVYPLRAPNGFYYLCTVAGVTGSVEPTWPTTINATVTDGSCTWKCGGPFVPTMDDLIV